MSLAKNQSGSNLKEILGRAEAPSLTLVICPDRIRTERALSQLTSKFFPKKNFSDTITADCAALTLEKVTQLSIGVMNTSLFNPQKLIILKNIGKANASVSSELLKLIESGGDGNKFIVTSESLPQTNAIYKAAKKSDSLIEVGELKAYDLKRWVEKDLKNNGIVKYDANCVDTIISLGEEKPDEISKIIEQLANYLDGEDLNNTKILNLYSQQMAINEFAIFDNLTKNLKPKAEVLITGILNSGKSPFAVLSLINRTFSNYTQISSLQKKGVAGNDIRAKLNMQPWVFNKNLEGCKKYSYPKLRKCLAAILAADAKLKNKSLGHDAIFSELIDVLCV